jgi:hypothetical protein
MDIHETGYAWRYIRKNGFVILWSHDNRRLQGHPCRWSAFSLHYVKMVTCSSMVVIVSANSVRLIPPSITYGFVVDNLPVATMSAMGASTIFACDVGSVRINVFRRDATYTHSIWRSMTTRPEIMAIQCQDGGY